MSQEKLTDLEKRIAQEQTAAARAYARLERLGEDIERVEKTLKDMGISSIEEAKERLVILKERMDTLISESYTKLEEAE